MKYRRDILFLCQYSYPEYVSSATLPFDTAKRLAKEGFSVDVLCGYPKEYSIAGVVPCKEEVEKVRIRRLNYIQTARMGRVGRMVNYLSFTVSVLLHFRLLKGYRLIIVYSNPPMLPLLSVWAKRLFKLKLVFVAYDIYPEIAIRTGAIKEKSLMAKTMRSINKAVYSHSDRVVVLSNEMKAFIKSHREIAPDIIEVIPNWYEEQYDQLLAIAKESKFVKKYDGKFVVAYLGNMGTCQDVDTVVECARLLSSRNDIRFLFAGHGNKVGYLKKTVAAEKLKNVDIYDFLQDDDYLAALAVSGCAVVSLAEKITGLCSPSKVYGYMMAGCPLIAIMDDSDITNDISNQKIGCHIRNGESRKMASFIAELSTDPQLVENIGRRCRQVYCRKYTTDVCTGQYVHMAETIFSED